MADNAEKMESKPNGFEGPTSPSSTYRTMDLILRVLSIIVSLAVLVLGGVSTAQSGVFLIGILGAPAACVILWSLLQFGLSNTRFEYMNLRSRFRMIIGVLITIGYGIAVICLGLFRPWWANGQGGYSHDHSENVWLAPNNGLIIDLTLAGLVLGCFATVLQIAICWVTVRRLMLQRKNEAV
ncbi:hypothetical protein E4U60_004322 [Claviceps pazoutovae]|uniref:Uncharacterized protein n=1 Tax=Claviceps pazoutovae TaxID=1649127 RepID=A0A9P7SFU3_9HYPO|nr:hypothetical protein E4U60_004322 [Claviceps pazoutovae]